MTGRTSDLPDLEALSALTRGYASFQARKSGLATALAGLLALLTMPLMFLHHGLAQRLGIAWVRGLALFILLAPLLWLPLKHLCGQLLYRGLGEVKAKPDLAHEQKRWGWIFGVTLVLVGFLTSAMLGYEQAMLGFIRHPETLAAKRYLTQGARGSWGWVGLLPCCYALAAPWAIRGIEEGRSYAVLVAQALIWIGIGFAAAGVNYAPRLERLYAIVFAAVELLMLLWAMTAMNRGWREHREYLAMLRNLPWEAACRR